MKSLRFIVAGMVLAIAACSPPLAATPTSAPAAAPTSAPPAAPAGATAQPASGGAATTGTAAADPLADVTAKYYDAAKQEGALVIYGSGPDPLFAPIRDAFQKRFPGINVQGVDQRGRDSREKVIAEQQSRNYVVDVVSSGTDTQASLLQGNDIEPYQAEELADAVPDFVQPGQPYSPRTVTIFTMAVNSTLVPPDQEPKSWKDILDPKWKGKLAMDDVRGSGPGGSLLAGLETVYGQDFSQKLADQNVFFATEAGPILTALNRGEYAIYLSSAHTDVITQKQDGAPIKQIRPDNMVSVTQIPQSLIKNAPHPNAAKLWIEWSLSDEGQTLLAQQGFATVRKGIRPSTPEASLEGVQFFPRDYDPQTLINPNLDDRTKRWTALFFKTS
jgi:iron(III) transport system substrate-binding protein